MISSAQLSLKHEKQLQSQKMEAYRHAFKEGMLVFNLILDYNQKQLLKTKQKDLDERLRAEQNMYFLQRTEDEINREKQYKQHFIKNSELQMRRGEAFVKALDGNSNSEIVEEGNIKIIKVPSNIMQIPAYKIKSNSPKFNMSVDQAGNYPKVLEDEKYNLETIRQMQYRKALESQMKDRAKSNESFDKIGHSRRIKSQVEIGKNTHQGMAMIPGINSTSPLIKSNLSKIQGQTLDEHRRKMKKHIGSSYGGLVNIEPQSYEYKSYNESKRNANNYTQNSLSLSKSNRNSRSKFL